MYDTLIADLRKSADLMRKVRQSLYMDWDEQQLRQAADAIEKMNKRIDFLMNCIYEAEDSLDRGAGNDWARAALEKRRGGRTMYETLVKRLRNKGCQICPICREAADAIEDMSREVDMDSDAMTAMDAAMPRWIPVTERLPEYGGSYITAFSKGEVGHNLYMTFADGSGKWYQNSEDTGPVTHWMPLPHHPGE